MLRRFVSENIELVLDLTKDEVFVKADIKLFSVPELHLLQVTVKKSPDTILIGNKNIPAEKFVFSGDWNATVWFDNNKQFLKWQYKVKGKTIVVLLDA